MNKLKTPFKILLFLLIVIIISLSVFYLSSQILKKPDNKIMVNDKTTKAKKDNTKKAKLTIVGDLLFEQPFYNAIDKGDDPNNYFKLVKEYFLNDDLTIGNMEVVIGNDKMEISGEGYSFCAPLAIGKLVTSLDFEVLSTANNHSYDRGLEGIKSTLEFFKNNSDILTVGTQYEDNELKLLNINDIKIGFISYTLGTNVTVPESYRQYINLYRDPTTKIITDEYKNKIKEDVERLQDKVDVIIALIHWGKEFTYEPNNEQKNLANYLNSLGVDIIVGSHSHSIQPIEWIGDEHKTLVYYSMGNFVSADDDISRTGETFDNAYQVGLLSQLEITKSNNDISINNITTEPIVNYYDKNMRNFLLIPLSKYNDEYEKSHYRYSKNFNKTFINNMYESVIDKNFR